jgi:hypothetical protein
MDKDDDIKPETKDEEAAFNALDDEVKEFEKVAPVHSFLHPSYPSSSS